MARILALVTTLALVTAAPGFPRKYCRQYSFNLQQAEEHLMAAVAFEYPPSHVAGGAAASVCAYQRVLRSRGADGIFWNLVQNANDAGKVYGLAGLHILSSQKRREAQEIVMERANVVIKLQSADESGSVPVGFLVKRINEEQLAEWMAQAYKGDPPW